MKEYSNTDQFWLMFSNSLLSEKSSESSACTSLKMNSHL